MNTRHCFENRTFHIYTEHNKNRRCLNESSEYIQKVKMAAIMNDNCKKADVVARTFGRVYPNYQIRNDMFDVSCNKIKSTGQHS
jgi:hypothetical protein